MNAMGRLNASTEIIPLQGPSGRNDIRFRQNFRPKPKPFFTDNLIVPRVKQYLEDHKDTVHVDMDAMVDELQRKYKDYARRKRNPFKQAVDKAFKAVLHQYGVTSAEYGDDQENSESSDDMYSEDIALESSNNSSATAGQIMNMYMNRPGVSTTSDMRRVHNRGNLQMGRYHHALNNAHHSARSILMPRAAVKREVEWHQSGVALPRRGESTGDKELINISSDEEDAGVGLEEGTSISIAKIPPKGQQGLLPTPTGILPSSSLPSTSAANGRGADSTATAVNQSVEAPRPKCVAATAVTAGLAGRGGSEQSPMRPWPAGPPTASSTPRQAKRPRIGPGPKVANNPAATPAAAASSTTPTPASTAGSAIQTAAGGRDSPTPKRRRDAATLATAASVSAARLSAAGPPLDVELEEAGVTFADLGGIDEALEEVGRLLAHLRRPEVFRALGVPPPRGILLHGPPGCGKSLLARAVAGELRLPLLRVAGPELVGGVSGESEARVRELFERAAACAPCVLLLDEVDALAPPRAGAQREMERRIVAQLLACLDDLSRPVPSAVGEVLVLGATSRPEALDPALRRAGRFDREVCLGIPDARARASILAVLCRGMKLESNVDLQVLAKSTPGFVGADLQALTREAALAAVSRVLDEEQKNNSEETKDKEKPASLEGERKKEDENAKDEEKPSMSKEKENVKEEETKENSCEKLEVIDISERDTPNESETNKAPAAKADSSVTKEDTADEDEVCIEAEVSSSDAAKDKANGKVASSPETGDDMEVVEELDEDEVVPVAELAPLKSALSNVWNTQFPTLTDEQLKNICVTQDDFSSALKHVQPSAKREGFATVPDTSWDDVGALRDVREELQMAILAPIRHPEAFESLGLTAPAGLLLCGPPGCGKTLIAKAIANEADINFISVKGPELLNMYVGESEKAVRQCFLRARNSAPCVIFFDELDALCPRRTGGPAGEGNSATQRVVNQLLTEMDGVEGRRGVFLLAASNRPDILDPAVLRPGRLDRIVFVGLPGPDARADILRALTKNGTRPPLAADVDLQILGESAELDGCSGADLAALVREAATLALRQHFTSMPEPSSINQKSSPLSVSREHLSQAVLRLRPSVSKEERERYEILRRKFSAPQGHSHSNKESPHSSTSSSTSSQAAEAARTTITLNETQTENKQIESSPTPAAIPEPATSDEPTKSD